MSVQKRKAVFDPAMLQTFVNASENQEKAQGNPRSSDPNFPVFTTPVNEDILVYIPRTNMVVTEAGESMKTLEAYIHNWQIGKKFGSSRCITGLSAGYEALNYDGACPHCEATSYSWELYNAKIAQEAKRLGIDPQNDPTDMLKPAREAALREMDLKPSEKFVTFPVVIVPTKGKMTPVDDWKEQAKVVYVVWSEKRYNKNIIGALESLMNNPGHPAGMFWLWKFKYTENAKEANARDSAQNAKYLIVSDPAAAPILDPLKAELEKLAAPFTLVKAAEVVIANQFYYKEDVQAEADSIIAKTRQMLELISMGGASQLGAGQPAGQLGGSNPLDNFGTAPSGNLGEGAQTPQATQATAAPANPFGAGMANPVGFGQ